MAQTCLSCGAQGTGKFCSSCGVSFATGKPKKGLSGCAIAGIVIGGLAVLSLPIIGIIAAIAIPNLLNAIERGKQKRTMSDIQVVAVAVEQHWQEHGAYPEAGTWPELTAQLEPTYIQHVPATDPWQGEFRYEAWTTDPGTGGPDSYGLASAAKEGKWEQASLKDYEEGTTQRYADDIVYKDGAFVRWPEGTQRSR